MQGLITVVMGVIGAFTIVDFPEKASNKSSSFAISFLNEKEVAFVVARIEKDRHDAIAAPFHIGEYLRCAADLKVWGFAAMFGTIARVCILGRPCADECISASRLDNDQHLRYCILPSHHSQRRHGFRRCNVAMSDRTALRCRCYLDVWMRSPGRQIPHPWSIHPRERRACHHRFGTAGFRQAQRCSILWRFPRHHWMYVNLEEQTGLHP